MADSIMVDLYMRILATFINSSDAGCSFSLMPEGEQEIK
jgi:hypothetical protein